MRFKEYLELQELIETNGDDILVEKLSNLLAVGANVTYMKILGKKEDILDRNVGKKYAEILKDEATEYSTYKNQLTKDPLSKIFDWIEAAMKKWLSYHVGDPVLPDLRNKKIILWLASVNGILQHVIEFTKNLAQDLLTKALDMLMVGLGTIVKILLNISEYGEFIKGVKAIIAESDKLFGELKTLKTR